LHEFLLGINLKHLLRKAEARLNLKINLESMHIGTDVKYFLELAYGASLEQVPTL
jgi:hypothetical protein